MQFSPKIEFTSCVSFPFSSFANIPYNIHPKMKIMGRPASPTCEKNLVSIFSIQGR
jgi:hypothetical protein